MSEESRSNPNPHIIRHEDIEIPVYSIVEGLIGIDGQPVNLVERIMKNSQLKRVFMSGEAGIGKTIATNQLVTELKKRGKKVLLLTHDEVLAETEKYSGESDHWTSKDWDKYSQRFDTKLQELEKKIEDKEADLIIADTVGIAGRKNRARTVIQDRVKRYPNENLVVAYAPDNRVQTVAGLRRDYILRLNPEITDIIDNIWRISNIHVEWLGQKPKNPGLALQEVIRETAPSRAIAYIKRETRDYNRSMLGSSYNSETDWWISHLSASTSFPRDIIDGLAIGALHLQLRLSELYELGLPRENGLIVINMHTDKPICWFIEGKKRVTFLVDGDGVTFRGLPITTQKKLLRGNFHLQSQEEETKTQPTPSGLIGQALAYIQTAWLERMPLKSDAQEYIPKFNQLAKELGLSVETILSSGRNQSRLDITEKIMGEFKANFNKIQLNPNSDTAEFKADQLKKAAQSSNIVVCLEDDLESALKLAKAAEETTDTDIFIYLLTNPTYSKWFLKRSGIEELPNNIILVKNLEDVYEKLKNRLLQTNG